MRANLAKRRAGLIDQQVDYMSGPLFAQGAKTPQECLAGKCRVGAERQRPGDIRAAAHAAVEDDGRPMTYLRHDGWQDVDRCRQRLNLSPSMFETQMPSTPSDRAFSASAGCMMPLSTSGRFHRSRKRATSSHVNAPPISSRANLITSLRRAPSPA